MKIVQAEHEDFDFVKCITRTTIETIYPKYYPQGAVEFFLRHHSDENIISDIFEGKVYLLTDDNKKTGTVTINRNEIDRLFVLPECQHMGYGRALIEFAENKILKQYNEVILSASLPAKRIYKISGYTETDYHIIKTENGDFLCFDMMRKMGLRR